MPNRQVVSGLLTETRRTTEGLPNNTGDLRSGNRCLGQETGHIDARRIDHGWICSHARDAYRTNWSAWRLPMIWRPTGRPDLVQPAGTLATGWPVRLNG